MKFVVLPSELKRAYAAVSMALSSKNAMPVLDNILFTPSVSSSVPEAQNNGTYIILTGSDGDNTIRFALPVQELEAPTSFLISARSLNMLVKDGLGVWPIEVEVSGNEIKICDEMGEFKMMVETNVSEYPLPKTVEGKQPISIDAAPIIASTTLAVRYTADDELRPVMQGVFLDFRHDSLVVAASDSKLLYREIITSAGTTQPMSVIVPKKAIDLLSLLDPAQPVTISVNHSIELSQSNVSIHARLIEGKYPRFEAVIPKETPIKTVFDRVSLYAAIRRAMIAANSATQQIKLSFDGTDHLSIEAQDVDHSTGSKVHIGNVEQNGMPAGFAIGFRGSFLLNVLNTHKDSDKVSILMSAPGRAALVQPATNANRITLVMPMALTDF